MKYADAQLISKYTELRDDGGLNYEGMDVKTIPIYAWEIWMNRAEEVEKKTFFSIMLQRALKASKKQEK